LIQISYDSQKRQHVFATPKSEFFDKAEFNRDACCSNQIKINRQRATLDAILLGTASTTHKERKIAVTVGCPDLKIIPHP
jgi:hypothetical protein